MNQQQFATALLGKLGIKPSAENVKALVGWQAAEGGNWHNDAKFNPLNTTQPEPGAGNTGTQGNIKVYKDWDQGVSATAATLTNGRYAKILSALRSNDAGKVAAAVGSSPWGTSAAGVARAIGVTPATAPAATSSPAAKPAASATPAASDADTRSAAVLQYLQSGSHDPLRLALAYRQLQQQTPTAKAASVAKPPKPSSPKPSSGGLATFDGKPVDAWIKPLLVFARTKGWPGTVVSGYRSDADQTRIYNSGVRPAAVPKSLGGKGSKHEEKGFLKGAVDATDPEMLSKILKAKNSRLKNAGKRDSAHFSVPSPDGSY